MFFDGGLLALGNILFIAGLTLIIGPQKTFYFFARKNKMRGTACFFGGILLVFFKRPFIGMLIETFGFLNLFGSVSPSAFGLLLAYAHLIVVTSSPLSSLSYGNYPSLAISSTSLISEQLVPPGTPLLLNR